jgi:branched-chain amino acid transport system permease protein
VLSPSGRGARWFPKLVFSLHLPVALVLLLGIVAVVEAEAFDMEHQVTTMLIYVVAVVGLYTYVGNSGVLSFGHVSFMMVGAYVTAILTIDPALNATIFPRLPSLLQHSQLAFVPGVLAGAAAAGLLALLVAFPIARLPAMSSGLAMFALLLATNAGAREAVALVTGGQASFFGVPQETSLPWAFAFASASIFVAFAFTRSRIGLRLRASREDEFAALASGINVTRNRVVAFILSGLIMGASGGLFVQFLGALAPDTLYLFTTLITMAMLVVGGMYRLTGAVVGAVLLSVLSDGLQTLEAQVGRPGLSAVGFAAAMLAILMFRPGGVMGSAEEPPLGRWWSALVQGPRKGGPARPTTDQELQQNDDVAQASSLDG